ncbi:protein-lysine N-methyltransferase Efm1p [Diutina catenulata]
MSMDRFLEWAKAKGAEISDGVVFKELGTNNLGAVSDGSIRKVVLSVPYDMIIHGQSLPKEDFGSGQTTNGRLKLWLTRERTNPASDYAPYLQILPNANAINSPLTWSPQDQELLKGTNLGASLKDHLAALIEEWWESVGRLPESALPSDHFLNQKFYYEAKFFTPDDMYAYLRDADPANWTGFAAYLWASLIIKSRAFPARFAGDLYPNVQPGDCMLLPVIDLLNHKPNASVDWVVANRKFTFSSDVTAGEVFNNYGHKSNEELLFGYGFVLENNKADRALVKIKVPEVLVEELRSEGVDLPKASDYSFNVEHSDDQGYDGGLLFYIDGEVPPALVQVFSHLVRNRWDGANGLRAQLMGLSSLTQALEAKMELIKVPQGLSPVETNVRIYASSQRAIFKKAMKSIKQQTKDLFSEHKQRLTTIKTVWKHDSALANALLVTFGFTDIATVEEHQFQDQLWLLWIIRCANREQYIENSATEDEGDDNNWLPAWVKICFEKVATDVEVTPQEIVAYKEIYLRLVPPLVKAVPEVFDKGDWGVKNFILAAKLLDLVSFVRGKDQECIMVQPEM